MAEPQFTTQELESEEWREVPELEGFYCISNLGRAWSERTQQILRPDTVKGYHRVSMSKDGKRTRWLVHQLVALVFIGPRPDGHTPNHIDGIKTNNRASNLEYRTPQGQMDHAKAHGLVATGDRHNSRKNPASLSRGDDHYSRTHPERLARGDRNGARTHPEKWGRGEAHWAAELTADDIRAIRSEPQYWGVVSRLAERYNKSLAHISAIRKGRTWKHLLDVDEEPETDSPPDQVERS